MRLSTKTRYGVRAMFDVAYHGQDQPNVAAQAKDIARREGIPLRYLEQIFQELKRAGLIASRRGPRGGYYLERDPREITLGQIVRALQGPIDQLFVESEESMHRSERKRRPAGGKEVAQGERSAGGEMIAQQVTGELWRDLARHIGDWFESVTIADLVARGEQLGLPRASGGQPMYFI